MTEDTGAKKPYHPKRSIKSPVIKTAVIAKRTQGMNKSQIARELNIAPNTVNSIIALSNLDEILADHTHKAAELVPEALRVARARLAKDSENMAIKVLENSVWPLQDKALGKRMGSDITLNQTLNVLLKGADPDKDKQEQPASTTLSTT